MSSVYSNKENEFKRKNDENRPIMQHKPHPENIVKLYALKQVLNELKKGGLIEDKED